MSRSVACDFKPPLNAPHEGTLASVNLRYRKKRMRNPRSNWLPKPGDTSGW